MESFKLLKVILPKVLVFKILHNSSKKNQIVYGECKSKGDLTQFQKTGIHSFLWQGCSGVSWVLVLAQAGDRDM